MELIHHHFEELVSTNDWGKAHLKSFDRQALTLVSTAHQTRGRGQYGRSWVATGENLLASYCFFLREEGEDAPTMTRLLAKAVTDVLLGYGISSSIKWPNDVLVDGKKIAGILCETLSFSPDLGVVIGIGLNVNMPQEVLDQIDQPATSIEVLTAKREPVADVLDRLTHTFMEKLQR